MTWGKGDIGRYKDACILYDKAKKYGYKFFIRPADLFEADKYKAIVDMMVGLNEKTMPNHVYIKAENYLSLLKIDGEMVTLTPEAPIKTKTVDGEEGIDKAFYLRILLNLAEDFGIDEIRCHL